MGTEEKSQPELTDKVTKRERELYPKHLAAFFVCAVADHGRRAVDASAAEKLVPELAKKGFTLLRFSYRDTPGGPSSPAVRAFFQFMTEAGYLRRYNPTVITDEGLQYCGEVVREYLFHDLAGAKLLAKIVNLDLARFQDPDRPADQSR